MQDVESDAGGPVEDFCPEDWVDGADVDVAFTKIQDADARALCGGAHPSKFARPSLEISFAKRFKIESKKLKKIGNPSLY